MRAVRIHDFGGPEVLKYEDAPIPEPKAGEVLVHVYAAGVNPVDWKIREGLRYRGYTLPLILGWDIAGVVDAVGPDVTKLKAGDEVYGTPESTRGGGYAEYAVVTELEAAKKPKSIDFIHAAAVPLAATTAWQSIFDKAKLSEGQTILIHGAAGGVGHYAVQFAKWKGAKVIGTATGEDMDFVRELGADEVIDYKKERFEDKVHDADVVLDLVGGETQERSWGVLKKGGILVSTVGIASPEAAEKHGVRAEGIVRHPDVDQLVKIAKLIDEGHVKPSVQTVLPLSEARRAHEISQSGHASGKIVLRVT